MILTISMLMTMTALPTSQALVPTVPDPADYWVRITAVNGPQGMLSGNDQWQATYSGALDCEFTQHRVGDDQYYVGALCEPPASAGCRGFDNRITNTVGLNGGGKAEAFIGCNNIRFGSYEHVSLRSGCIMEGGLDIDRQCGFGFRLRSPYVDTYLCEFTIEPALYTSHFMCEFWA